MKIAQIRGNSAGPWSGGEDLKDAHLVLVFGDCNYFQDPACFQRLSEMFPNACIAGCSSAGTILGSAITDDVVATAIKFANGHARLAVADVTPETDLRALAAGLIAPALWGSTLTLALGMGTLMLLGGVSAWLHQRQKAV